MPRNLGIIPSTNLQSNIVDWCYAIKITVASPVGVLRYTDWAGGTFSASIDGGTQTWTQFDIRVGGVKQGRLTVNDVQFLSIEAIDYTWQTWANSPGLRGATVEVWHVQFDPVTRVFEGATKLFTGMVDNHEYANGRMRLALKGGLGAFWEKTFPCHYPSTTCLHIFKEPTTCQYAGVDTSCAKTIDACTAKANTANFGGFLEIPDPNKPIVWAGKTFRAPTKQTNPPAKKIDPPASSGNQPDLLGRRRKKNPNPAIDPVKLPDPES